MYDLGTRTRADTFGSDTADEDVYRLDVDWDLSAYTHIEVVYTKGGRQHMTKFALPMGGRGGAKKSLKPRVNGKMSPGKKTTLRRKP